MVIAYHLVFAAYGFWPPNDPRGSWSERVWAEHLQPFGPAKTVYTRQSLARVKHDPNHRLAIQGAMKFPPVNFDGLQAHAIGRGFKETVSLLNLMVVACAIMPNHTHLVIRRHSHHDAETIIGYLKRSATRMLVQRGLHPFGDAKRNHDGAALSPWVRGGWKRFLNDEDEIVDAMMYVRRNPSFANLKPQRWSFVQSDE